MEPIFTLPYAEWMVAQQLTKSFRRARGYSVYTPLSRQEKGADLPLGRHTRHGSRVMTIQVKSSRTYSRSTFGPLTERRTKRSYLYYT